MSIPLEDTLNTFKTHRFDCDVAKGVEYYLDDKLMHTDDHNVPKAGGSLQLKLWADGNKWWSGMPSSTDTYLRVKNIVAYFNTTTSLTNEEWHDKCHKEKTQCKAVMKIGGKRKLGQVPQMPRVSGPSSCVGALPCSTGIGAAPTSKWLPGYPKYTGSTAPKVTPPSAGGPRTSGSDRAKLNMLATGGLCLALVMLASNMV